jgi:hypothetical protein
MTTYLFPPFYVLIYNYTHIYCSIIYTVKCFLNCQFQLLIPPLTSEGRRELAQICAYNTQWVGHQALKLKYSSMENYAFTCLPPPLHVFVYIGRAGKKQ